ncbi:MAG: hypothetical protein ACETWM_12660 [Candidatus Lokiarchaeia archaeon]
MGPENNRRPDKNIKKVGFEIFVGENLLLAILRLNRIEEIMI